MIRSRVTGFVRGALRTSIEPDAATPSETPNRVIPNIGLQGMKTDRPINLALTTFKYPLAALASITHRITGVLLFVGIAFLLYLLDQSLTSAQGLEHARSVADLAVAEAGADGGRRDADLPLRRRHQTSASRLRHRRHHRRRAARGAIDDRDLGGADRACGSVAVVTNVTSFGRSGLSDFVIQRVTAVVIALYVLCIAGFFIVNPNVTFDALSRILREPADEDVLHARGARHRCARVDRHVDGRHRLHPRSLFWCARDDVPHRLSVRLPCACCSSTCCGPCRSSGEPDDAEHPQDGIRRRHRRRRRRGHARGAAARAVGTENSRHLQGVSDAVAHRVGAGRHHLRDRERRSERRLALAHVRHRQGVGLHRRPGRDRVHVQRRPAGRVRTRTHGHAVFAHRVGPDLPATVRRSIEELRQRRTSRADLCRGGPYRTRTVAHPLSGEPAREDDVPERMVCGRPRHESGRRRRRRDRDRNRDR